MKNKTLIIFFVLLVLCLVGLKLHAQTNLPALPSSTPVDAHTAWAALVADDARKLVFDLLSGISWTGLFSSLFMLYAGGKGLRNYTPLGNSKFFGALLNLINLEKRVAPTPVAGTVVTVVQPTSPTAQPPT